MIKESEIRVMFSNRMYQRGKRYYNQGLVHNCRYDQQDGEWHAAVLGSDIYHISVTEKNGYIGHMCSCPAHDTFGECKHVVAALFKISDMSQPTIEHAEQDFYNNLINKQQTQFDFSSRLIDVFADQSMSNSKWGKERLQTEFTLKSHNRLWYGHLLELEMKVGVERTYVVKSLSRFLASMYRQEEHVFTQKFSYNPSQHYFSEEDKPIIDILLDIYENDQFYDSHLQRPSTQKSIVIPPAFAPKLLPLLAEKGVSFEDDLREYPSFDWIDDDVPFDFLLFQDDDQNSYKMDFGLLPQSQVLKNYGLIQKDHQIISLDDTQRETLERILPIINQLDQVRISKEQIDSFVSQVVPNLDQLGRVQMSDTVSENIVDPELVTTIHLDYVEGRLTADIRYHYGDVSIDPMRPEETNKLGSQILVQDPEKEQRIMKTIEYCSFKFNGHELYLDHELEIFNFLFEQVPELRAEAEIYLTDAVSKLIHDDVEYPTISVDYESGDNYLEVNFDIGDINEEEISHLIQSVVEKKRFYRLSDGTFVPLEDESLTQMTHLLDELNLKPNDLENGSVQLPTYRGLQLEDAVSYGLKKQYNQAFEQLIQDIKSPNQSEAPLPSALHAELRDYQKTGFQWLKSLSRYRFGGILADDMGLGKTLQSIAFLLSERVENPDAKPAIVISPASLVYNWQAEFEKFAPTLKTHVISGTVAERKELLEDIESYDVIVTSYPLVRQDVDHYENLKFSTLILDEAQAIKNHLTKQAKAVRAIQASQKFALSGTPIENSLDELWSIFDVILPKFFPNKKEFKNLPQEQVSRMSRPFILRRIKQDVLTELPDKIESVQYSDLTKDQKELYLGYLDKIKNETANAISNEGFQQNRMKILAGLTRLRQLCCHPSLFIEGYEGESGKMNQLMDMVNSARENNHRILIFSQFASMLKILHGALEKEGYQVFYLDGQTPSKDRVQMVDRFNEGEKDIFLISLRAGGTGLNLTGADTVILYDLWWNPAVEEQAAGRAHRIGQKQVVQVHRLVTKGTIEEKIYALQQRKRELIENVIQPGETMFNSLSEDDIRELLNV
ncbi:DEAD/DEAH box helicase [Aquisalibacillus elongatus]|uniref:SNF2 family DNA or RNA helicase n=1 Tax=Aquisalibacillus elongatus TaxID=485577 RepID=A0A3N5AZE0_9BACI|nr:DEAD/DEAH box helicase [Aquisalibacillus elongatus]RPF50646.1 SNF2 family DNA or RNA helicase [Aquisalibacillus elongatus]